MAEIKTRICDHCRRTIVGPRFVVVATVAIAGYDEPPMETVEAADTCSAECAAGLVQTATARLRTRALPKTVLIGV